MDIYICNKHMNLNIIFYFMLLHNYKPMCIHKTAINKQHLT